MPVVFRPKPATSGSTSGSMNDSMNGSTSGSTEASAAPSAVFVPRDAPGQTASNAKRLKSSHGENNPAACPTPATLLYRVTNRPDYTPTLMQPYDVIFIDDGILIAEGLWPHSRLQLFDLQGRPKRDLAKGHILPFGVAYNATEGHVAVTDHKERTVKIFDLQGGLVRSWDRDMFDWPNGITVNNFGQYLVADWARGSVGVYDGKGNKVITVNTNGSGTSDRSCPEYVVVDSQDRIIITDTYDHSVKIFDHSGSFLSRLGHEDGPGKIRDPRGLTLDNLGNVIVADWGANTLKHYNMSGQWLGDVVTQSQGLQHPWGVAFSPKHNILAVTEQKLNSNPALQLFQWNAQ